jgi:hypothetical protein
MSAPTPRAPMSGPIDRAGRVKQVLAIAVEMLPTITDDLTADLVEHLARTIVDQEDALRAARQVVSTSLQLAHAQHTEIDRLRKRLADLLDERRQARTVAA